MQQRVTAGRNDPVEGCKRHRQPQQLTHRRPIRTTTRLAVQGRILRYFSTELGEIDLAYHMHVAYTVAAAGL